MNLIRHFPITQGTWNFTCNLPWRTLHLTETFKDLGIGSIWRLVDICSPFSDTSGVMISGEIFRFQNQILSWPLTVLIFQIAPDVTLERLNQPFSFPLWNLFVEQLQKNLLAVVAVNNNASKLSTKILVWRNWPKHYLIQNIDMFTTLWCQILTFNANEFTALNYTSLGAICWKPWINCTKIWTFVASRSPNAWICSSSICSSNTFRKRLFT